MSYNSGGMKKEGHKKAQNARTLFSVLCLFVAFSSSAFAQVNLSGVWDNLGILHEDWPDRLFGPELGDYTGVPLTDEARLRAEAWDASLITLPELTFQASTMNVRTFATIPIFGSVLAIYFALAMFVSKGIAVIEERAGHWRKKR